jgi:hypothetical protein
MNVLGLGTAGCKIASLFEAYPQYNVFYADVGRNAKNEVDLPTVTTPEEADDESVSLEHLDITSNQIFFIMVGSGVTSTFSLRVLEQLKTKDIFVVYVRPKLNLLNEKEKKIERMVFGILQEYARSGVFKRIYLLDNKSIEGIIGDTSLASYFIEINKIIVSTMHMLNYLSFSKKIMDNLLEPNEINRVCTVGILDLKKNVEKKFFDLKLPREKQVYYLITRDDLTNDKNLLNQITEHIEGMKKECESVSFSITESSYEESHAYTLTFTNVVQEPDFLLTEP